MKKIGLIAGAFDLIHPGYIDMFSYSKKNCDYLIVALHNDPSLERLNKISPLLSINERKKILEAIKYIDEIIIYNTEIELLEILKSNNVNVRFLGDDYHNKDYTGIELDIPIVFIDRSHNWSTTKLKKMIIEKYKNIL